MTTTTAGTEHPFTYDGQRIFRHIGDVVVSIQYFRNGTEIFSVVTSQQGLGGLELARSSHGTWAEARTEGNRQREIHRPAPAEEPTTVGTVTTARRAHLHLSQNGRARCNSSRAILASTARPFAADDAAEVCGHCRRHLAAAIAQEQADAVIAEGPCYSERNVRRLIAASDALLVDAERAEVAKLAAQLAADLPAYDVEARYRAACAAA
jgi:hypothetical protein